METSAENKEKGEQMSRIGDYAQEFLDEIGYNLGYSIKNLPDIKDVGMMWYHKVPVWENNGMTEEEYYGVDENEGKTMP